VLVRAEALLGRAAFLRASAGRPESGLEHMRTETIVPASVQETFAFFSDASNLERLTPPWLNFGIRTPMPVTMREGLEIDYRIVLYGIPFPWRTRIDVWEPGRRFVDRQTLGPYRWWRHEHAFAEVPGGTRVHDHVEYVPRVRWLSSALVRRDVTRIFAYRGGKLQQIFRAFRD
jgi:ligand-binding SRPBCC domain-containing protein